ncbi:hypothetical protein JCM10213_002440 [Rhodosporidiobolus nylandii]
MSASVAGQELLQDSYFPTFTTESFVDVAVLKNAVSQGFQVVDISSPHRDKSFNWHCAVDGCDWQLVVRFKGQDKQNIAAAWVTSTPKPHSHPLHDSSEAFVEWADGAALVDIFNAQAKILSVPAEVVKRLFKLAANDARYPGVPIEQGRKLPETEQRIVVLDVAKATSEVTARQFEALMDAQGLLVDTYPAQSALDLDLDLSSLASTAAHTPLELSGGRTSRRRKATRRSFASLAPPSLADLIKTLAQVTVPSKEESVSNGAAQRREEKNVPDDAPSSHHRKMTTSAAPLASKTAAASQSRPPSSRPSLPPASTSNPVHHSRASGSSALLATAGNSSWLSWEALETSLETGASEAGCQVSKVVASKEKTDACWTCLSPGCSWTVKAERDEETRRWTILGDRSSLKHDRPEDDGQQEAAKGETMSKETALAEVSLTFLSPQHWKKRASPSALTSTSAAHPAKKARSRRPLTPPANVVKEESDDEDIEIVSFDPKSPEEPPIHSYLRSLTSHTGYAHRFVADLLPALKRAGASEPEELDFWIARGKKGIDKLVEALEKEDGSDKVLHMAFKFALLEKAGLTE